jgi:hypothetical protein
MLYRGDLVKKVFWLIGTLVTLFSASSILAGSIPKSEFSKVEITSFNVIYERSRLLGEILNNSAYDITECQLKLSIYKPISGSEVEKIHIAISEKYDAGDFAYFVERMSHKEFEKLFPLLKECYTEKSQKELELIIDDFFENYTRPMLARKLVVHKDIDSMFSESFEFNLELSFYRENHIAIVEIIDLEGRK